MTATERLRALLDEHGIEYETYREVISGDADVTTWTVDGRRYDADTWEGASTVALYRLTPEQAIEVTLGRGECCKTLDLDGTAWVCSECGEHIGPRRWNYCPNCGRKVAE